LSETVDPPAPSLLRQGATTQNQDVCSFQAEAQIEREAAAKVGAGAAEMTCQVARGSGLQRTEKENGATCRDKTPRPHQDDAVLSDAKPSYVTMLGGSPG
jgi:hypothetical protein